MIFPSVKAIAPEKGASDAQRERWLARAQQQLIKLLDDISEERQRIRARQWTANSASA